MDWFVRLHLEEIFAGNFPTTWNWSCCLLLKAVSCRISRCSCSTGSVLASGNSDIPAQARSKAEQTDTASLLARDAESQSSTTVRSIKKIRPSYVVTKEQNYLRMPESLHL